MFRHGVRCMRGRAGNQKAQHIRHIRHIALMLPVRDMMAAKGNRGANTDADADACRRQKPWSPQTKISSAAKLCSGHVCTDMCDSASTWRYTAAAMTASCCLRLLEEGADSLSTVFTLSPGLGPCFFFRPPCPMTAVSTCRWTGPRDETEYDDEDGACGTGRVGNA